MLRLLSGVRRLLGLALRLMLALVVLHDESVLARLFARRFQLFLQGLQLRGNAHMFGRVLLGEIVAGLDEDAFLAVERLAGLAQFEHFGFVEVLLVGEGGVLLVEPQLVGLLGLAVLIGGDGVGRKWWRGLEGRLIEGGAI